MSAFASWTLIQVLRWGLISLFYQGQFTSCLEIASFYYIPLSVSFFQRGSWLARIGFQFKFSVVPEARVSHITSQAPVATRQTSNTDLSAVKVKSSRIWGFFPAWIQSWYSHPTHVFLPFFLFSNDQSSPRIWKMKEQEESVTVSLALLGTLVKYVAFRWREIPQDFKALSW